MRPLFLVVLVISLIWVTVAATLGAIVAPAIFSYAPPRGDMFSRDAAGAAFGAALMRWLSASDILLPALLLAVLGGCFLLWRQNRKWLAGGILVVAAVMAASQTIGGIVTREANTVADAARSAGTPVGNDPRFANLHRWSSQLFSVEAGAALVLTLIAGVMVLRPPQPKTTP